MSVILEIANLTVRFPGQAAAAVDGVSLALRQGEIFGVVGESGSGKSTLAAALMGLLPGGTSVAGRVSMNGREVTGLDEAALRTIRGREAAMIFQDASTSLDPTWSVGDQIAETIRAHAAVSAREAKARALALMDEVGIPDPARRYGDPPHRLSGGQRQRIVIAAALANNPQLLIADEPTTALDVTIQKQVLELIDRLRRKHGTTVLLITHDLGVVSEVCDRVGVMYGGRLLETSTVADLFARPAHPYTRMLLAANPSMAPRRTRLPVASTDWNAEGIAEGTSSRADAGASGP